MMQTHLLWLAYFIISVHNNKKQRFDFLTLLLLYSSSGSVDSVYCGQLSVSFCARQVVEHLTDLLVQLFLPKLVIAGTVCVVVIQWGSFWFAGSHRQGMYTAVVHVTFMHGVWIKNDRVQFKHDSSSWTASELHTEFIKHTCGWIAE